MAANRRAGATPQPKKGLSGAARALSAFKRTARRGGSSPEGIWILLQPIDFECEIYLKHRAGLVPEKNQIVGLFRADKPGLTRTARRDAARGEAIWSGAQAWPHRHSRLRQTSKRVIRSP